jgi:uncharacterized protein
MSHGAEYLRGIDLFNRGDYFGAHDVWEIPWRAAADPDRALVHSLIQAAVALYHHGRGNPTGARRLASRGRAKAARCPPTHLGIDLTRFWNEVDAALAGGPAPRISLAQEPCLHHGSDHV